MITGGCGCGGVRYVARGAPMFGVICHCRDCQRASGTGHVPIMGVSKARFELTGRTRAVVVIGGSGMNAIRHYCPDCLSLLFGTPEAAPELVTIYVGSLDDPALFRPQAAINTGNRPDWDRSALVLPEFEGMPPVS